MGELQGNVAKALVVKQARPAIVAAANEFDSFAADVLKELSADFSGTLPSGEYTDALAMSMVCAELHRVRARVEHLERGEKAV